MNIDSKDFDNRSKLLFTGRYSKILFFISILVISIMMLDTSLTRVSDLFVTSFVFNTSIALYIMISIVCAGGQYVFLRFVRQMFREVQSSGKFHNSLYWIIIAIQSLFVLILGLVIFQLFIASHYSLILVVMILTISYLLAAGMMLLLAKSFFAWYKINKNSLILLYGISAIALTVHFILTPSFVDYVLSSLPGAVRTPFSNAPFFPPGSPKFILGNIYTATSISSFLATWSATALLLHYYSERLGKLRYWIMVALPLVYFISQFPALFFEVFNPLIRIDPFFYGSFLSVVFLLSKPAGGILFGIAFWLAAKKIRHSTSVRNYMIISGYGFILLFSADEGVLLTSASYPPFGLATVSFMGLAAYLIFNGIFFSAISVSQNTKLRREIKQLATNESKLLDNLGSAEFEKQIQNKFAAIAMYEEEMAKKVGAPQSSLDLQEAESYLQEVINEVKSEDENEKEEEK